MNHSTAVTNSSKSGDRRLGRVCFLGKGGSAETEGWMGKDDRSGQSEEAPRQQRECLNNQEKYKTFEFIPAHFTESRNW